MAGAARHDVVVIGGGTAGVSAAIECADIQLDVVLLEGTADIGGQIAEIPHTLRNVATAEMGNPELIAALAQHASTLGERLHLGEAVTKVDLDGGVIEAGADRYPTRCVLLATGSKLRQLPVAPDGSYGGFVTYQVEAHMDAFSKRSAAVIGGGDSAVLDALSLAAAGSPSVYLVHRAPSLTSRPDLVAQLRSTATITELAGWDLDALVGQDDLQGIEISRPDTGEKRTLDVGGLVLKLGRAPRVDLVRDQVDIGHHGGIVVDASLRTSHQRAFAAGDVVEGAYARVATATGQGSYAAHSILVALPSLP